MLSGFQRISVFELRWVFLKTGSGGCFSSITYLAGIWYHPNRSLFKNTSVHGRFRALRQHLRIRPVSINPLRCKVCSGPWVTCARVAISKFPMAALSPFRTFAWSFHTITSCPMPPFTQNSILAVHLPKAALEIGWNKREEWVSFCNAAGWKLSLLGEVRIVSYALNRKSGDGKTSFSTFCNQANWCWFPPKEPILWHIYLIWRCSRRKRMCFGSF